MTTVLEILLTVNLIVVCVSLVAALRTISLVGERIGARLDQLAGETTATLAQTRDVLDKVETLTGETERLIHDEATPAIHAVNSIMTNMSDAIRGINESVQGVRRTIAAAERLTDPKTLATAALKVTSTPQGKAAVAGIAAAAIGARTLMQGRTKKSQE
jgi:uncharacterized protein YoxC